MTALATVVLRTRLRPARAGAAILTALALAAGACGGESAEPEPVVSVQTATAEPHAISAVVTADAVLYPLSQAAIVPKVSAPVEQFFVQRGRHVTKGERLAVLEHQDLAAAVDQARGAYEQAQANEETVKQASVPAERQKAELDVSTAKAALDAQQKIYDNRQTLVQQGALPQRDLQDAQVALAQAQSAYDEAKQHLDALNAVTQAQTLKAAEAQLTAAQGQYEAAQAQLSYTTIVSPIDGVVSDRPFYAGEMATAGTPLLTVIDTSSVVARTPVPAEQAATIRVGNTAEVAVPGLETPATGKVTVVSPALDPSSTTVQVWVTIPNPGGQLKPGASVRVAITTRTIPDALTVPEAAVLADDAGAKSVMVVGSDHKAHARPVETGLTEDGRVQITAGLKAGETVVTAGAFGLEDGTTVQVEAAGTAPADGGK